LHGAAIIVESIVSNLLEAEGLSMNNWRDRWNRFMYGRYGQDQFSRFLLIVGLVFLLIGMFVRIPFISTLVLFILVYDYYRMFSRNVARRSAENQKYLEIRDRVTAFFRGRKGSSPDAGTYHIYRCPKCGQKIRVPKGKGMIMITCPKCHTEFRKRS